MYKAQENTKMINAGNQWRFQKEVPSVVELAKVDCQRFDDLSLFLVVVVTV